MMRVMADAPDTFEKRAERRRQTWTGGLVGRQTAVQASETTVEDRVLHMGMIAEAAWAASGQVLPAYTRAGMPGRVIRKAS